MALSVRPNKSITLQCMVVHIHCTSGYEIIPVHRSQHGHESKRQMARPATTWQTAYITSMAAVMTAKAAPAEALTAAPEASPPPASGRTGAGASASFCSPRLAPSGIGTNPKSSEATGSGAPAGPGVEATPGASAPGGAQTAGSNGGTCNKHRWWREQHILPMLLTNQYIL